MCGSSGVTWVSGVKSCLSAQLWSVMMGILEVAAPLSTTRREERSSACSDKTAHLQTGPSDSEMPHPQCPGESGGGKLHQGLNCSKWGRRVWSVITQQTAGSLKWWNISVVWTWCFSPPERPVPTACRPPAPLWLMEARLSSGVIVQSKTGTQRESSNLKTNDSLLNTLVWFKLCVCALTKNKHVDLTVGASGNLSDRTPRSGRQKLLKAGVKHLPFVLCTDKHTFTETAAKHTTVCMVVWIMCKLTAVEHCFHVEALRQEQIGLPFEGLKADKGIKRSMFLSARPNRYCFTTFHCIRSFKFLVSTIPAKPGSQIWQQHGQGARSAYQAAILSLRLFRKNYMQTHTEILQCRSRQV